MKWRNLIRTSFARQPRRLALLGVLFFWFFVLFPVLIIQNEWAAAEYVGAALPIALYGYVIGARRFLLTPQRRKYGLRSRLMQVVIGGGVVVCLMLLVVYCVGFFRLVSWASSDGVHHISTHAGRLDYFWGSPQRMVWRPVDRGFQSLSLTTMPSAAWWPPASATRSPKTLLTVRVLIWMIFALVASLAFLAWYLDLRRRPKPGHCPCGYDLTGNTSGVCPECGVEVPA